jgi:hypothetical protein
MIVRSVRAPSRQLLLLLRRRLLPIVAISTEMLLTETLLIETLLTNPLVSFSSFSLHLSFGRIR